MLQYKKFRRSDKMATEELRQAKAAMKEVVNVLTPEEKAELVRQYKEELIFGKKRFY